MNKPILLFIAILALMIQVSKGQCPLECNSLAADYNCDEQCNTADCDFDGGDCVECSPGCILTLIGDGSCDGACINEACQFDGKDCACTQSATPSTGVPGTVVLINGEFPNQPLLSCYFDDVESPLTEYIDFNNIRCTAPEGFPPGKTVTITFKYIEGGELCGTPFQYSIGSGTLDPHFAGFHGEKMEVKRDEYAANQLFHLYCSNNITIISLFYEYPDKLLFMTKFWVRLGDSLFTLDLSTQPHLLTSHGDAVYLPDLGRKRIVIENGHLEWDDSVLRVTYDYLKINFSNKRYINGAPYMNIEMFIKKYPNEEEVTGIIGRTLHRQLSNEQFEQFLQFKASTSDIISFTCPNLPMDTI